MAISENWAELLEPGLRQIFNVRRDALVAESRIPMLFNIETSSKAQEHYLGVGGMSDWTEFSDGRIDYDDNEQLYKTTFTHREYTKGFKVERKLVDDDQYSIINPRPSSLATSAVRTREKHAASVFNNAFSATVTYGDGVSLCNTAHPLSPHSGGGTHGNQGALPLSYNSVVETRRLMREFPDDKGELVTVMPDTLIVPPELEEAANAIWRTGNMVDTADAHDNFVANVVRRVIVWDYLTDPDAWFYLDSMLASEHLLWLDRVALEFAMDPTSDFSLEARFRGYMRYSHGASDWRFIYGNNPA